MDRVRSVVVRTAHAMHAMVLTAPGAPLQFQQRNDPTPGPGAVRIAIGACGVCRTDLHVVDGELPGISYPIIPGHEVVGRVEALGPGVTAVKIGDRVGVPLARLHLRRMRLLQEWSGKSLRSSAVHGLHARRWLCHTPC